MLVIVDRIKSPRSVEDDFMECGHDQASPGYRPLFGNCCIMCLLFISFHTEHHFIFSHEWVVCVCVCVFPKCDMNVRVNQIDIIVFLLSYCYCVTFTFYFCFFRSGPSVDESGALSPDAADNQEKKEKHKKVKKTAKSHHQTTGHSIYI